MLTSKGLTEVQLRLEIIRALGYKLFPTQQRIMEFAGWFHGLAGGIKYGKTWTMALFCFAKILFNPGHKKRLVWLVANSYDNSILLFDMVLDFLYQWYSTEDWRVFLKKPPSIPVRDSRRIELINGVTVETRSAGNPESLHQKDVWGLIVDEFGLIDRYVWEERILSRVLNTPGAWIGVAGTWEGDRGVMKEWYDLAQLEDDRIFECAPSWENTERYPEGYDDPQIQLLKKVLPPEVFGERHAAIPKRPSRLVYPEFRLDMHCGSHDYKPGEAVYLAVDPGTQVGAVLVIQKGDDDTFYVVDEIYEEGWSTEAFKEEVATREWFDDLVGGTIDDKARDQQMAWGSATAGGNFAIHLTKRPVKVLPGIERVKTYLFCQVYEEGAENVFEHNGVKGIPKIFINKDTCPNTIKEFRNYKWAKTLPRSGAPRAPIKKDDHAMNALAYFLIGTVGFVKRERRSPIRRPNKFKSVGVNF